ncbi:MAG TPA: lysophospholipid acyltransferase family protein [Planctomycetaceae bacterium]|nr:lysophospholipid acyltransferase family protein [Planctomycetaceae bacterium]
MDRTQFDKPPRWWGPRLSPAWIRLLRPLRLRMQRRVQRLLDVDVRGIEHLRAAVDAGQGVLITPNHSGHADTFILYHAADQLARPFYFMAAWQVLGLVNPVRRAVLRWHGCFSVDREGTDLTAFKQAVEILQSRPNPLVIFPEGEVYHVNERVTPFREGPATIALSAAKRAERPVVCVPCGIRYFYTSDPTPELLALMDRLEQEIFWRPARELPLPERIYRFAEGMLALKELEYLGQTSAGPLPARVAALADAILQRLEACYGIEAAGRTVPERVKSLRQQVIEKRAALGAGEGKGTGSRPASPNPATAESASVPVPFPSHDADRTRCDDELDDLYFVIQLFSYPGDYVAEKPTIERLAETLDKFEEDVLRRQTATIRGTRRAVVSFGEPVVVDGKARSRDAGPELTRLLEQRVQALLDAAT